MYCKGCAWLDVQSILVLNTAGKGYMNSFIAQAL